MQFNASDILPVVNGGTGAGTLTGYVKAAGTAAFIALATIPFSDVSARPTTVAGYGITDALTPASWAIPGAIGATTPNSVAATTGAFSGVLSGGNSSTISGFTILNAILSTDTFPGVSLAVRRSHSSVNPPDLSYFKSRGTAAAPTTVINGDYISNFIGYGYDGTNYTLAAGIQTLITGAVSAGVVPSAMIFGTANNAGTYTERMRLAADGSAIFGGTVSGAFNGTLGATTRNSISATIINGNNSLVIDASASNTTHSFTNTASNGVQFTLTGNGATTPAKTLRVVGGVLDIVNSAYSAAIFSLTDAGNLTITGALAANAPSTIVTSGSLGSLSLTDTGASGVNFLLTGNGAVTPSKFLRVANGSFDIINNAYSAVIFSVTDAGICTAKGAVINGKMYTPTSDLGSLAVNTTVDLSTRNVLACVLAASFTFMWSNPSDGQTVSIFIVQDATGSRTPTLPAGKWPAGVAGIFSTAANAVDQLFITYRNSTYYYTLNKGYA